MFVYLFKTVENVKNYPFTKAVLLIKNIVLHETIYTIGTLYIYFPFRIYIFSPEQPVRMKKNVKEKDELDNEA